MSTGVDHSHIDSNDIVLIVLLELVEVLLLHFRSSVQDSVFRRIVVINIDTLLSRGDFRVGGGVHDSYTFQWDIYFPGIDTR